MPSDLWSKFQSAVRWAGQGAGKAAIAVLQAAPEASWITLLDAQAAVTAKPADGAPVGMNVNGIKTVDLAVAFATAGDTCTLRVYVADDEAGTAWHAAQADQSVTAQAGDTRVYLDPFDCESWARMQVRLVTPGAGAVTVKGSPYNSEA